MSMNRREFVKGAFATGAAATLGAALSGCSPQAPSAEGGVGSTASDTEIGKHTWEVKPAPITDVAETKDYDIVIVGAGMAGLSAAEAAARSGAKVAVLERTEEIQLHGADVGFIGSRWKKEAGEEIDVDDACRLVYQWSQQTANYDLIRFWFDHCGPVADYIEELVGTYDVQVVPARSKTAKGKWATLDERWRVYPSSVGFVREGDEGIWRPDKKRINYNLGEALWWNAEDHEAAFFFSTHAEQLVGNAQTGITGVIAKDANGSYVQYNASKGVVLATGDIGGNQEMLDVWAPIANRADGIVYTPEGGNTGDGILMGCWAGAACSKSPAAPMVHPFTPDSQPFNLTAFVMSWLAVDTEGKRFCGELPFEPMLTNGRMNCAGNKAWSILDADYATYMKQQWPENYEALLNGLDKEMADRLEKGTFFKANTLDDLAKQLGIPADNLKATAEQYSNMARNGRDTQFGVPSQFLSEIKTPPFYAVPLVCSVLVVPFGLHVDINSQVCTGEDEPIPGLFAVGNVQGDFFGLSYPVHVPGLSHGRCMVFGQLVGEALAKDTVITKLA